MSLSVEESGGRSVIKVDGEFTIFQAAELKPELVMSLRQNRQADIELDLSRVTEIDSTGVQLLLVLKREAQKLGKSLTCTHHSKAVLDVIDLLNLGGPLGDPLLMTA